jgi:hypothetical protein
MAYRASNPRWSSGSHLEEIMTTKAALSNLAQRAVDAMRTELDVWRADETQLIDQTPST